MDSRQLAIGKSIPAAAGPNAMHRGWFAGRCLFGGGTFMIALILIAGCSSNPQHYVHRGEALLAEGNYAEAELSFRKALQAAPANGAAQYGLGKTLLKMDKLAEGYRALGSASQMLPNREDVKVALADVALGLYVLDPSRKSQYDQVVRLSREILALNPQSADGKRLQGYLALADGAPQEAIAAFEAAGGRELKHPQSSLGLSQALLQIGRFPEAERLALRLLDKEKAYLPAYDFLYYEYLRGGRNADAVGVLERKIGNNPKDSAAILQLAAHHSRFQDSAGIEKALKRLLDDPVAFPIARLQAGDFYAGQRRWPEALGHYESGAQQASGGKAVYYKKIASLQNILGQKEAAMRALELALKEQPDDREARTLRATILVDGGKDADLTTALAELQDLAKQTRDDATIQFQLGRAQLRRGMLKEAGQSLSQVVRMQPQSLPARLGLAEVALRQGKADAAREQANEILKLDRQNAPAHLLRAVSYRLSGQFSQARADLNSLKNNTALQREVALELAMLAMLEKRYSEAEQAFRQLDQQNDPSHRSLLGLTDTYLGQGKFDQALAVTAAEVGRNPDSWSLRNLLATVALRARKHDLAVEQYRQMLRILPQSTETQLLLGEAYRQKGDLANARRTFEEATKAKPDEASAWMMLAQAQHSSGGLEDAEKSYRRVLKLSPGNPFAQNNLAYLLMESGADLNQAESLAQAALQKARNQPNFTDTLGMIYLKKGLKDSAVQLFSNLVSQHPQVAEYRYHLALALVATGDRVKARQELVIAAAKAKEDALSAKIKALSTQVD